MRLFLCTTCESIEELPDYDGPMVYDEDLKVDVPAQDDLLEYIITPHRQKQHAGQLIHVEDHHWRDHEVRGQIIKQIKAGVGGLGDEAYAVRDTFQEDALKCYRAHNRPQDGCIDYKDRSKILGNAVLDDDEKRVAKKAGLKRTQHRFLCEYCPVHTAYAQRKQFEKSGLYN